MKIVTTNDVPDAPPLPRSKGHTLVLLGERPTSWNDYWAGKHWTKRKAETDRVHQVVRSVLTGEETPYDVPVNIRIIAYFDHHPLDASNICEKPFEDALKGWLIVDDSPKYVASMTKVPRIDKDNPRVEIEIREVE